MQTIIFDFGNVIGFFDHNLTLGRVTQFTDMSAEEIYTSIYSGSLEFDLESGRISATNFLEEVLKLCRFRCDIGVLQAAFVDIFRPNPEVCELIPILKKRYRLVIGSNTNEMHAKQFLGQFTDVLSHFDHLVLSHEIKTRKPHADFFEHCVVQAKAPAAECLFIDDMPINVAAAQSAGLKAFVYKPEGTLRQSLREHGIHTI